MIAQHWPKDSKNVSVPEAGRINRRWELERNAGGSASSSSPLLVSVMRVVPTTKSTRSISIRTPSVSQSILVSSVAKARKQLVRDL